MKKYKVHAITGNHDCYYKNTNEKSVERLGKTSVETKFGKFDLIAYEDTIFNQTHLVLKKVSRLGEINLMF